MMMRHEDWIFKAYLDGKKCYELDVPGLGWLGMLVQVRVRFGDTVADEVASANRIPGIIKDSDGYTYEWDKKGI